ncbi:MAG: DUF881 domain-containing protein [Clostridia bacterium]|nr:DUF881 domain-containing protein [Clostridia bacterium]
MKKNIKKGKITMTITLGIACFALVMVMSMQFKIVNETDITSIENMRETELRTELANWKTKYEETNQKYEETISKINEYKETKQSNEETSKLVEKELEQVNMSLGKNDIEGQGIEITIRETEKEEISRVTADDLIVIVNALRLSGAEAISINDERIINMTDIVDINETYIKINGQRILSPYVIKAIGDQSYLESGLIGNGGHVDEMKKIGQDVSIEKINKIKINKYNGEIKTKYME